MRKKGFTLVELLVVISIIAMLLAILMPSLQKARELAKGTVCMSRIKQLGLAFNMYSMDNKNIIMPAYEDYNYLDYSFRFWNAKLTQGNYTDESTKDVFYCPSNTPKNYAEAVSKYGKDWGGVGYCFGMRVWHAPSDMNGRYLARKVSVIKSPQTFFVAADSILTQNSNANWGAQFYKIELGNLGRNMRVHLRHSGKANTLFADGHADKKDGDYFENLRQTQSKYMIPVDRNSVYYIWPEK